MNKKGVYAAIVLVVLIGMAIVIKEQVVSRQREQCEPSFEALRINETQDSIPNLSLDPYYIFSNESGDPKSEFERYLIYAPEGRRPQLLFEEYVRYSDSILVLLGEYDQLDPNQNQLKGHLTTTKTAILYCNNGVYKISLLNKDYEYSKKVDSNSEVALVEHGEEIMKKQDQIIKSIFETLESNEVIDEDLIIKEFNPSETSNYSIER